MSSAMIEIIIVLALIFANGLFAMAEIAVLSSRKARLQQRAETGDQEAQSALELAQDPSDFLSTVQVGITLVGVLAGAFGGATIANRLALVLEAIEPLAPYRNAISITVVVVLITYLTLVFGELVPKRLALIEPERIASRVADPMRTLSRITSPLVRLLSFSTDTVLRLFGVTPSDEPPVTEEEVRVMIEMGTEAGVFGAAEQEMVSGVFRLADRRVGSLMTPRPDIYWLDLDDPPDVNRRKIIQSPFSRLPVAIDNLDHVEGIIQAKTVLAHCLNGEPLDLHKFMIPAQIVPESMLALQVLELFRSTRIHIALVIDEFGGLQGLVTILDVIEAIVGELPGAEETGEPEIIQREDGSYLLDGMLPIDEFVDEFKADGLPLETAGYYQTVGGFVLASLGRIPESGDYFEWGGFRFEVMDMDGFRVDKVLLEPIPTESSHSQSEISE